MTSTDPDEYLTVADVAGSLKLNPQTVRDRIDRGELPALRVGRRVGILRSDFDALLENPRRRSSPISLVYASTEPTGGLDLRALSTATTSLHDAAPKRARTRSSFSVPEYDPSGVVSEPRS